MSKSENGLDEMYMKTMRSGVLLPPLAALLVGLGGCATSGGVSDEALAGDPTAMLADGSRLNTTGAELVAEGEERIGEGREQVARGEAKIREGNDFVVAARRAYIDQARISGEAASPRAVEAEARKLREIGDRWQDAIDEIREGNALVDKGNRNIDRGQSETREGRLLMERGSTLVRDGERIRLGSALREASSSGQP